MPMPTAHDAPAKRDAHRHGAAQQPGINEPGVSDLRVAQSRAAKYRDLAHRVNSNLHPAKMPHELSWRASDNASKLTVVIERPDQ